jgi:hypothetical protein
LTVLLSAPCRVVLFSNDAKFLEVDILAYNGVVYKIDTVLDPADGNSSVIPSASPTSVPPSSVPSQIEALPEDGSIVDFVVGNPDLTSLTAAVVRVGLVDTLDGPGRRQGHVDRHPTLPRL